MRCVKKMIRKFMLLSLVGILLAGPAVMVSAYADEDGGTGNSQETRLSEEDRDRETGSSEETSSADSRDEDSQEQKEVLDENTSEGATDGTGTREDQEKKEVKDGSSEDKNSTSDPFTSIGNAEVRDDITDGSTKEFLTIVTKNNQTFYIVIDRSSTTDNVYMLSNIDENDLAEFLSETSTEEASTETPAIVLPELTREEEETTAAEGTEQKEEEKSGFVSGMSWMGIILLAAAVAFAAALYLKVIRPRNEAEEDPGDEGLEAASYEEVDEDAR